MLSIPFKKTDASTDLAGPLRRYLMKEFPKEEVEKYKNDLEELKRLRATATQVERTSEEGRECLLRYAVQLESLEPVFPVSETEVRIGFKWGDAFNQSKKSTQSTLLFERACVLYNLGAHESRSASQEDRSKEAGLKEACHRFQIAAGIFQYIRERVVGGLVGTLTQDLIPDGLNAASTLMLAQAQACFYEKAVKDRSKTKLKPTIIAKLAAKAGEFYSQTLSYMQGPNLAPGMDKSWPAHVEFQSIAFAAAGYYWESVSRHDIAEDTSTGYGLEIAQLQYTAELLDKATRIAQRNGLSSTFTATADTLSGSVAKTLTLRRKDNATVYMEPVASKSSLTAVTGASMVKAIVFVEATPGDGGSIGGRPALFDGLLSKSAKAALELYNQKESKAVAELDGKVKEQTTLARNRLAEVGLPGTVEAHVSVEGVPESVWKKVQAVKEDSGGLAEIREKVSAVDESAKKARDMLELVERTLDDDQRQDESFRARYAGEYDGMTTVELCKDLRRDVEHYRELWRTGREADQKVMSRLEEPSTREGLELLELPRASLDAAMPAGTGAGAGADESGVHTEVLLAKLVEMTALLADRETKLSALTEFVKNRNVAPELAKASRGSGGGPEAYSGAVELALQGLEPFRKEIETNLEAQGPLLEEILSENEKFQQARASDPETLEREAFLQKIHGSVTLYHEVHAQLSEGVMFYTDLLQRLGQLKQTCEDLVYTQGLQRREFEVGYTHRRDKAIQEGEGASIELARRMAAQAQVAQGGQNAPTPAQAPAPGITKPAGYTAGGAYGQVPWSAFTPSQTQTPGTTSPPRPHQSPYQPQQQSPYQPPQQPPYQPPQKPYQAPQQPYQAPQQPYQAPQQPYQAPQQPPYQPPQQPYQAPQPPHQPPHQPYQPYQPPQQPYQPQQQQEQQQQYGYGAPSPPAQNQPPYQSAQSHGQYGAPHQPQASTPGAVYYGQDGAGNKGGQVPTAPGPAGYAAGPPSTAPAGPTPTPPANSQAPGSNSRRWGAWLHQSRGPSATGPAAHMGGQADPNEAKFNRLLEMGFDPAKIRAALAATKGNEDAAVSKLLSEP